MTDDSNPVLTLREVQRTYGKRVALKSISLELFPGELLGFFGPNGAGKTTMIRCISGLLRPHAGTITFQSADGGPPPKLGVVPQNLAIYPDLTVEQNLRVFGRLEGVTGRTLTERIDEVLDWAALDHRRQSLAKTLSGGMQRRVNIACSVLHQPGVLLLDEPTVGVDPQSRERIYTMMGQLTENGAAVLLTTHQLEEVETRCDRIVVIDGGEVVAGGTLGELVAQTIGRPHRVSLTFAEPVTAEATPFEFNETRTSATCAIENMRELPGLLGVLSRCESEPTHIDVRSFGLQDVFLELTGRRLRE